MIASVIIPTFNKVERLKLTLMSLERQTVPTQDFEVLVVNDGSSDETEDFLNQYQGPLHLKAFHEENSGQATARNVGIANATGEVLIFTDDDVYCKCDYVEGHVKWHQKNREYVAVIGEIQYIAPERFEEFASYLYEAKTPDISYLESFHVDDPYINMRRLIWDRNYEYVKWICFTGANASVKAELLKKTGVFDQNFYGWGPEDAELGYRINQEKVAFLYDDTIVNFHMDKLKSNTAVFSVLSKNLKYFKDVKYKGNVEISKYVSFGSCGISLEELNHICSGSEEPFRKEEGQSLYYFRPLNYFNKKTEIN